MLTADLIREIRIENDIKQKDLAELIGVPAGTWGNMEVGRTPLKKHIRLRAQELFTELGVWRPSTIGNDIDNTRVSQYFDVVDKPSHYNMGSIEVIDVIKDNLGDNFESYAVGNILKYMMRYKHKGGIEDLKKARFYLNDIIHNLESGGA